MSGGVIEIHTSTIHLRIDGALGNPTGVLTCAADEPYPPETTARRSPADSSVVRTADFTQRPEPDFTQRRKGPKRLNAPLPALNSASDIAQEASGTPSPDL